MMKEEEERRSLLLLTTTERSKRSHFSESSFTPRFLKRISSSRSLEDDASSSSSSSLSSALTGTWSRVMMILMCMFMFTMGITFETKREKGMRFQHQQHLGDTLNTTKTDDIAENTSNDKLTFTLYTQCSPMDKVLPTLRGNGSDDINDDDMKEPYDWFSRVKAKLVLKDDDENIGGNDFSFNRGIPMEQITCGAYRVETGVMKRGTAFGFALYEIPPKDDDDDNVSSLGRLIHYENQRNDAYEFEPEGAVVVKDIGCLTTDPKRVDKRCPWGERGGVVGGYSSSIAEDEREHPFGMRECTYKYEYGDVTFYNRVFDGKQLEYVWGSCLESCPAFTKHPFCAAAATPTSPPIEEVEEKKEEEEEEESSTSNQTSEVNDEEEDEENEEEEFTCEDGHHVIADGETNSCGECPPGSFSFTPNDASCQLCPKGFFQPFGKSDRCEACPKGMYQDEEGQRFCKPCDGSEISPDDMTELKMEELHDEGVPIGGVAWKMVSPATNDSPSSSRLGVTKRRSSRREQNNSNRKLLGGGLFGKGGWFSDDDDENDINGDGVVDARDVIEREIEDARAKGKGAESKDQCVASSASPVIVVDDQDGTIATNDDKSTPIDVNVTSEMTKDRVIPMPTTPKVNVVVSDEAKEARKEREPEATFESAAQETPFPVNTLDAAAGNVSTKATEIDPEVIADEAATLKNSVRHEKELNDLLREKEVDDDDTIVDKKIVKEEAIIETFEKVNVKELEKIDQTLASVAAEEAATVKDASLSTSVDVEETKEDSTATTTTMTSSSPSSSCDETVRGEFGVGYRGCQTTTRTGKKCIDWSKQPFGSKYGVAHAKWSHQSQPDFMDENPRNYCRNPSASADGIWCYVDAQGGFDSCEPIKRFAKAGLGIEEESKEVEEVHEQQEEQEDVFTIAAADRF